MLSGNISRYDFFLIYSVFYKVLIFTFLISFWSYRTKNGSHHPHAPKETNLSYRQNSLNSRNLKKIASFPDSFDPPDHFNVGQNIGQNIALLAITYGKNVVDCRTWNLVFMEKMLLTVEHGILFFWRILKESSILPIFFECSSSEN